MKSIMTFLLVLILGGSLSAQESITNIVVTPKTDGTGEVDIYYDLSGPESNYTITLEASFDGGINYTPVAYTCLTGDIGPVQLGTNKHLIWDGKCSNSETYSTQTKVKIIATFSPGGTCGDPITDARDGQTYNTVQIGTQCWMAENLNVGTMINGNSNQTNNGTIEKYCYGNNTTNCDTYGGLYQWDEMMQYVTTEGEQGICPTGWHLPTDNEWKTMEIYLGMTQAQADAWQWRGTDEGGKMKEAGTAHWISPNTGATNSSGFNALPGGSRGTSGAFGFDGGDAYFWSSGVGLYGARFRQLNYYGAQVYRAMDEQAYGYSVRCVRD